MTQMSCAIFISCEIFISCAILNEQFHFLLLRGQSEAEAYNRGCYFCCCPPARQEEPSLGIGIIAATGGLFYVRMNHSAVTTTETLSHSLLPLFKEFILTIQSYFGYVPDRRLQYFAVTIVKYLMEIYRDKQRLGANYL